MTDRLKDKQTDTSRNHILNKEKEGSLLSKVQLLYNQIYLLFFQSEYNGERTVEGIAKFIETDGVFGMAAPDHDEL